MPLREHLLELRKRLFLAAIGLAVGAVAGWFLYEPVFELLQQPLLDTAAGRDGRVSVNFAGLASAFDMQIKVALFLGVIVSSPWWLYQLWAFITPALHKKERRYALGFLAAAIPLFLGGCAIAIITLPTAVYALTAFTPEGGANFVEAGTYLRFFLQLILTFGISCVVPVLLVGLNMMGLLSGRSVIKSWRIVVVVVLVIAAMAAPGPDPITMVYLAVPLLALFFVAAGLCLYLDRRKAKRQARQAEATGASADRGTSAEELRSLGSTAVEG